jgi:hypothetical protein
LPEKGKPHQEQSQICVITALAVTPAARRLNAGRLQKSAGNGSLRQMAAMKLPKGSFSTEPGLWFIVFFDFLAKNASFH